MPTWNQPPARKIAASLLLQAFFPEPTADEIAKNPKGARSMAGPIATALAAPPASAEKHADALVKHALDSVAKDPKAALKKLFTTILSFAAGEEPLTEHDDDRDSDVFGVDTEATFRMRCDEPSAMSVAGRPAPPIERTADDDGDAIDAVDLSLIHI